MCTHKRTRAHCKHLGYDLTLHFLNRRDWGPRPPPRSVWVCISLQSTGCRVPLSSGWAPWPPQQTCVFSWRGMVASELSPAERRSPILSGILSLLPPQWLLLLLLPPWLEGGVLDRDPRGQKSRLFGSFPPGLSPLHSQGTSHLCSICIALSPETERYLCLVPKACKHYTGSQRTSASRFRDRLPKAQLEGGGRLANFTLRVSPSATCAPVVRDAPSHSATYNRCKRFMLAAFG